MWPASSSRKPVQRRMERLWSNWRSSTGGRERPWLPACERRAACRNVAAAVLNCKVARETIIVWDVNADAVQTDQPKGQMMSEEAGRKLNEVAENPSDDALFHRGDATYLEQSDDPNQGYDPHNKGYDGKDKVDPK